MRKWLLETARRGLALTLSVALALPIQTVSALADGIVADGAAPAARQPGVDTAPNGVPLVDITAPTAGGVSHNQYSDFNVGTQGVILNNSRAAGASQLGGAIAGNPNLTGAEASIILNEVTSANRSALEGYTEIFGRSADYILANPNGITCNGCGFINTPRATLTTGVPTLDGGMLDSLSVGQGDVLIEGAGINAENISAFDIIARTALVNAEIHATDLTVITGRNDVDYATRATAPKAPDASVKPSISIDSSLLGGMYAGRITLESTEAGVGVNMAGDMAASAGELRITANGNLALNKASASGDLTASSGSGDIDLQGNAYSGDILSLSAAGGRVSLAAGTTSGAQNAVEVTAANVTLNPDAALVAGLAQNGQTTQSGSLTATVSGTLRNDEGLLASGDSIALRVENLRNDEGVILSVGDMAIEGAAGGKSQQVFNESGTIESAQGNIAIRTENLTNRKKTFSVGNATIYSATHAFSDQPHPGCNSVPGARISGDGCKYFYRSDRGVAVVPHWQRSNFTAYYSGRGRINDWVVETRVVQDSEAALISSGGDLSIDATTLNNRYSHIAATGDATLTGTTLNNTGARLTRDYYVNSIYSEVTRCYGGVCSTFLNGGGTALLERTTVASVDATIMAGGTISGDFTGQINNTTIVQTADSANIRRKNYISEVGESTATPDGEVALIDLADFEDPGPLFTVNEAENHPYVIETRFAFTDLGSFYGSEYFLNRIGLNPGDADYEALPKRLGDAFFDTRLVRDAVIRETGMRWLDDSVRDDIVQMKSLLDNGAAAAGDLRLSVGVALTAEQISALTSDIVWYVTEEFQGRQVLVPHLYLATASRAKLGPKGALVAANDIDLDSDASIENSGIMAADQNLDLQASDSIANRSGSLRGGGAVRLVAENGDVINETTTYDLRTDGSDVQTVRNARGEIVSGGDLQVTAGRDIRVAGADVVAGGDANLAADGDVEITAIELRDKKHFESREGHVNLDRTNNVGATVLADGNLAIQAGGDARVAGSAAAAGEDLTVRADGDIAVTSVEDSYQKDYKFKKKSFGGTARREGRDIEVRQQASALGAGGDITLEAGGDTTVTASALNAGGDLALSGDDVTVDSAQDYDYHYEYRKKSGFFAEGFGGTDGFGLTVGHRQEKHAKETEGATQVISGLSAGEDVTITAREDAVIDSAVVTAGQDVTVTANDNVEFKASQDTYAREEEHEVKQAGLTVALKQNVTAAAEALVEVPRSVTDAEGSAAAKSASTASAALKATDAVLALQKGALSAEVSLGVSSSEEETSEAISSARVAQVQAGRDVTVTAGEDITGQGVQVAAGRDVALSAGDDIALTSAQDSYSLEFESSSQSASAGASVGIGVTGWTASASASVSASESEREVDSLTHTNSRISAGRDLTLSSGDDTTLKGALATAEGEMDVNVGGDLTVASVQDTARIDGSSSGFSAGLSYGLGGGDWGDSGGNGGAQDSESGDEDDDGPSALDRMGLNGSLSHGDEKGRKAWVREQSGLVAGGDVNVEVGGHTQLDGAVVASTGGDVTLETETLGYSDIRDHDDYRNVNGSIGGSLSLGGLFGDEDASVEAEERGSTGNAVLDTIAKLPTVEGGYEASERDQATRATVAAPEGEVDITVRADPDQDLSDLNTDLDKRQEVTKDESTKVEVYVSGQSLAEVVSGFSKTRAAASALSRQVDDALNPVRLAIVEEQEDLQAKLEAQAAALSQQGLSNRQINKILNDPAFQAVVVEMMTAQQFMTMQGAPVESEGQDGGDGLSVTISPSPEKLAGSAIVNAAAKAKAFVDSLPAEEAGYAMLAVQMALGPGKTAVALAAQTAFDAMAGDQVEEAKRDISTVVTSALLDYRQDLLEGDLASGNASATQQVEGVEFLVFGVLAGSLSVMGGGKKADAPNIGANYASLKRPTASTPANTVLGGPDDLGRPTGVVATINRDSLGTGTPASPSIIPPGFGGQGANHARGHLLARMLGGVGDDARNLVTLFQRSANHPNMSSFERQVLAAVNNGETVSFRAVPIYTGNKPVPIGVTLTARGSSGFDLDVSIPNINGVP